MNGHCESQAPLNLRKPEVLSKLGPTADGRNFREFTVLPVESETNLRRFAWIEEPFALTGGRIAKGQVMNAAITVAKSPLYSLTLQRWF
jgi:hypothetical protein